MRWRLEIATCSIEPGIRVSRGLARRIWAPNGQRSACGILDAVEEIVVAGGCSARSAPGSASPPAGAVSGRRGLAAPRARGGSRRLEQRPAPAPCACSALRATSPAVGIIRIADQRRAVLPAPDQLGGDEIGVDLIGPGQPGREGGGLRLAIGLERVDVLLELADDEEGAVAADRARRLDDGGCRTRGCSSATGSRFSGSASGDSSGSGGKLPRLSG